MAWFPPSVNGEPFASSAPHLSPPGALNWPTIFALGTCAAVRKNAVGRSTTTASTCFCLSAVTTSFESLKTFGWELGLMTCWTASRLVVPICTPSLASCTSPSDAAFRRRRGLQRDERLRGGEVRRREVDLLLARRRDRDLVDVEVELLRPRRV